MPSAPSQRWVHALTHLHALVTAALGPTRPTAAPAAGGCLLLAVTSPGAQTAALGADGTDDDAAEVMDLVTQAQEGSAYAFALLYDRYIDQVYGYVAHRVGHRQTAEDLTADVFLRALKRIRSFRWQGKDFGAWLMTIARNRCHDHFRSARFRRDVSVADVEDTPPSGSAGDDVARSVLVADARRQVHEALRELTEEQAEVLYHRFIEGRDVAETATLMGKREGAVRALQYRALKALSRHIDVEAVLPR